jgi:hypothetical protein
MTGATLHSTMPFVPGGLYSPHGYSVFNNASVANVTRKKIKRIKTNPNN